MRTKRASWGNVVAWLGEDTSLERTAEQGIEGGHAIRKYSFYEHESWLDRLRGTDKNIQTFQINECISVFLRV